MRSGFLGIVVAHSVAISSVSAAAFAETSKSAPNSSHAPASKVAASSQATAAVKSEPVDASALALGQPPSEPVQATAAPANAAAQVTTTPQASPPTVAIQPAAPVQTVTSPSLASTAVIANGAQTTAVVDIRLLPKHLAYRGEPSMDGYVLEERRRWWMIIAGGALFGIGYIAAVVSGNEHEFDNGFGFTAIPIAGPWVTLVVHDDTVCESDVCVDDNAANAQLVAAGLLQLAGAVLLPIGLMSNKQVWLRKDLAIGFAPSHVGRTGYGAVVQGTF